MINDTSIPLVLIGTNSNIFKIHELAETIGYNIVGIIDDDYHGQGNFRGIPIIAKEEEIASLKDTHQFFCVTNWLPYKDEVSVRNRLKRSRYLELMDQLDLNVATIVSPQARVSKHSTLGKGVYVEDFSVVEPDVTVSDYVSLHVFSYVGHATTIGRNSVLQRFVLVTSYMTIENDVYFGLCSKACRNNTIVRENTFLHSSLMLLRDTEPDEVIGLVGKDLRRIYEIDQPV